MGSIFFPQINQRIADTPRKTGSGGYEIDQVEVTERLELWEIDVEGVDFGGADVAHKK
jgi:hypothetical protein